MLDLAARYSELGEALLPVLNPILTEKYGIELGSFIVENVSVPPEVEGAIDKRSSMAAIGNLNDYVKLQLAESLKQPGGGGVAGLAAQFALGTQIARDLGTAAPPVIGSAPTQAPGSALPELLSPAEVAQSLGVSEADVLAALADGSLKGKKIGSAWRVTRAALEEFLKH